MRKVVRGRVNRGAWVAVLLLVLGGVLGAPALASSPGAAPYPAARVLAAMTRAAVPTTVILLTGLVLGSGLSGGILGLLALYLAAVWFCMICPLYTSPSPRDRPGSRMQSSA